MVKKFSPAADRNKEPILKVLYSHLESSKKVLEIASGSGQHCVFFSSKFPNLTWQPTDIEQENLDSIREFLDESNLSNVKAPHILDTRSTEWNAGDFDLILCANMIHISPIESLDGLLKGAAKHLTENGHLVLYGPFFEEGVETAPSNLAFDKSLKERNPKWGIRHLSKVEKKAKAHGLSLIKKEYMPANNLTVIFSKV